MQSMSTCIAFSILMPIVIIVISRNRATG